MNNSQPGLKTRPPQACATASRLYKHCATASRLYKHCATASQPQQLDVGPGSSDPGLACNTSEKYLRDTVGAGACVSHVDVLSAEHLFSSDDGSPGVKRENG